MSKLIQVIDDLAILCGKCAKLLGHGHTYGHVFYCDTCLPAVQELDTDH